MSSFDHIVTLSLDEASMLEKASNEAISICRAKAPAECIAIESAVLWAAGITPPYSSDQLAVEAIATVAVQRHKAACETLNAPLK